VQPYGRLACRTLPNVVRVVRAVASVSDKGGASSG
jgi:hypothetical protein